MAAHNKAPGGANTRFASRTREQIMSKSYRFTFGPWNISTGEDPFGPASRKELSFAAKLHEYKRLGFDGVQLHDDDAVDIELDPQATERAASRLKKVLDGEGLPDLVGSGH